MSIDGILMIAWYAAQPWLWLIAVLCIALVLSLWLGRHRHGPTYFGLWPLSVMVGVLAMLLAPALTNSQLRYVATWPDLLLLAVIGISAMLYTWLLCKNWLRQGN
ncbi:MAG: oxidoreductase [Alkalimonas sp.]|nr:oxidoreductase [Alkalimonas sp.]